MSEVIWKKLIYGGIEYNNIEVSVFGQLRNAKTHHIYKTHKNRGGYERVNISLGSKDNIKDFKIHRAVAETFIPNPDNKPQVNHIDGNKQNNTIENLEWVTASENMLHAYANNLWDSNNIKGMKNPNAKLTNEDIIFIRTNYTYCDHDCSIRGLAKKFNVGTATIWRIINNKSYVNV